jgi:N-acetylneuraminic acid mutarotase
MTSPSCSVFPCRCSRRNTLSAWLSGGLLALCLAAASSASAAGGLRVLIVDGQNNHLVWPRATVMMKRYLEETGRFTVDVARTRSVWKAEREAAWLPLAGTPAPELTKEPVADPGFGPDFSKYDLVVSNFGWKAAPWPEATRRALEKFVADGGALVVVHAANNSWPDWPEFNRMTGLGGWGDRSEKDGPFVYYDRDGKLVRDTAPGPAGKHAPAGEFLVTTRDSDHPITRGLPAQWMQAKDECYSRLRGPAENLTVLATAADSPELQAAGRNEPMLMALTYGRGRVFHTTLGHDIEALESVGFIVTFQRGAEWAATGAVTQAVPADFPTAEKVSRRPFPDLALLTAKAAVPQWETLATAGQPHARHEAAFVGLGEKLFLLGGRRIQPVDVYDLATGAWSAGKAPPVETHHFQPVAWEGKIWLPGAMTGKYPHETALAQIPVYDPAADAWSEGPALPADRRRGGSGAVILDGKLYVICGIINGHWDGHVAWLDALDLRTGLWTRLADAPRARDHFQAAVIDGKIYVAGGRRSSGATKQVFDLTIPETDVYDPATGRWSTLPSPAGDLPRPRAGTMSLALDGRLLVAGGESMAQPVAHDEVSVLDPRTGEWRLHSTFTRGRHGSGLVRVGDRLYVVAGSGGRGGRPELTSLESLSLKP